MVYGLDTPPGAEVMPNDSSFKLDDLEGVRQPTWHKWSFGGIHPTRCYGEANLWGAVTDNIANSLRWLF